ncbi:hypothetical protein IMG5_116190 [Ichthyophthirius multifiliis]|uniref:Uncharacterized protein n=1 Tax=Ichthyophthirius multifiliis TaxID=5932 RepID=G0QUC1_ICHMU|nr:hypothetical protein IMG5_116190 [Ichthyophthirius multifiliis]EGR31193.1 hypothetical protein IMG5_116190 [Ichthyophthirius multifiliis]|eukprot:XP_004034679.1 hypothetical protein IMG5_116190 [Ichthyophthirius multifiliis]
MIAVYIIQSKVKFRYFLKVVLNIDMILQQKNYIRNSILEKYPFLREMQEKVRQKRWSFADYIRQKEMIFYKQQKKILLISNVFKCLKKELHFKINIELQICLVIHVIGKIIWLLVVLKHI